MAIETDEVSTLESSTSAAPENQQTNPDASASADDSLETAAPSTQETGVTPQGDATNPDPVQEAMARLAKPETAKAAKADDDAPAPEPQAKDAKKVPEPPPKAGAEPSLEDPYKGWLDNEQARNRLRPQTRQWIEKLHGRWKEAETHPDRLVGADFNAMLSAHKLTDDIGFVRPDELAGLVKVQAAIGRSQLAVEQGRRPAGADLDALRTLSKQVSSLQERFGLKSEVVTPAAPQPYPGQLPQAYQELIDVFRLPEKQVRLLYSLEQSGSPAAPPASQAPAAPAPTQPPAQVADLPPEGVDMEAIYSRRLSGEMAKDGVTADRFAAHVLALEPRMKQQVLAEFPGLSEAQVIRVFNAMSPKERADITLKAHKEFAASRKAPAPNQPQLAPPTRQSLRGTSPRTQATAPTSDAVESAVAFLSRRSDQE